MERTSPPKNVYEYWTWIFNEEPHHDAGTVGLKDYPMTSHCGKECKKVIDKAKEFIDLCRPIQPAIESSIKEDALQMIEVICFG